MEFVQTPIRDVVDYLADVHKTRIALDGSACIPYVSLD